MEKTGVIVTAYEWSDEKGYTKKNIDIADLTSGMYVREIGGLLEITDPTTEDEEDYMLCTNKGLLSPLCIDIEHEGKIVMGGYDCDHYICSNCGEDFGWFSKPNHKYCPNCGWKLKTQ